MTCVVNDDDEDRLVTHFGGHDGCSLQRTRHTGAGAEIFERITEGSTDHVGTNSLAWSRHFSD